jgi:hypothetical protein
MIYRAISFMIALMCCVSVQAQNITPSVVNATGGSTTLSATTFEWNVGESIVSTFLSNSGGSITSGSDFTKCLNGKCPMKESCQRYKISTKSVYQPFHFFQFTNDDFGFKCLFFKEIII